MIHLGDILTVLGFGSICMDVVVVWKVVLDVEEVLLEGCVLVLESLVRSSFIIGWFMVHGAVLGRIVLCIILRLILISFKRV